VNWALTDKEFIMKFAKNIILNSDSYKYSQWVQYPEGTEFVYSYIESRGGAYDQLVYFGLQAFLREYMTTPVTAAMVIQAREILQAHGEPFNYEGWMYIVNTHGGHLPVEIKAVDEGTVMRQKNVLVSIVNTDPKCYWLTSFLETALLRAIWYPTTVASNSYVSKTIIAHFLEKNGDPSLIDFKLHDFGARGVSSLESAALGGMAHLINFMGTDTLSGVLAAMEYYDAPVCGFSIPAMEHSTVTSWGRENEVKAYRNMMKHYARPGALLACVSDSYDIYEACKKWGTELKDEVIASGAVVVVRPDSGDPVQVVNDCLKILDKYFGHTVNAKGYKVLNNVRIIQGDGIDHAMIRAILTVMDMNGYSADNVAFGQGGALLQMVNRDTLEFAMKCSAAMINGVWVEVYKDPVTSSMKKSKKGRLMLVTDETGKFVTKVIEYGKDIVDHLHRRYMDGRLYNETTFDQVRENSRKAVR
jgi:nicotinamide phosphoribosyltransferase